MGGGVGAGVGGGVVRVPVRPCAQAPPCGPPARTTGPGILA